MPTKVRASSLVLRPVKGRHDGRRKLKLFKVVADELKGKTLIMGNVGTNNTAESIAIAKKAEATGVDLLLCIVPYYNKPNQDAVTPTLQPLPRRRPCRFSSTTYRAVPAAASNRKRSADWLVTMTTSSASKTPAPASTCRYVAANAPEGFHLYSGEDNLTLPIVAVGGEGVITVAGHVIGKEMDDMIQAYKDGDVKKAAALHQQYLPFMKGVFCTVSPVPIKTMVNMLGFPAGPLRLPLVEANPEIREKCQQYLKDIGKL